MMIRSALRSSVIRIGIHVRGRRLLPLMVRIRIVLERLRRRHGLLETIAHWIGHRRCRLVSSPEGILTTKWLLRFLHTRAFWIVTGLALLRCRTSWYWGLLGLYRVELTIFVVDTSPLLTESVPRAIQDTEATTNLALATVKARFTPATLTV